MPNFTERPLLTIKELVYIIGAVAGLLYHSNKLETKIDKLSYMYDIDKAVITSQIVDIRGQLAELNEKFKIAEYTKPEDINIKKQR